MWFCASRMVHHTFAKDVSISATMPRVYELICPSLRPLLPSIPYLIDIYRPLPTVPARIPHTRQSIADLPPRPLPSHPDDLAPDQHTVINKESTGMLEKYSKLCTYSTTDSKRNRSLTEIKFENRQSQYTPCN